MRSILVLYCLSYGLLTHSAISVSAGQDANESAAHETEKPKPKTATQLKHFLSGTTWNIREGSSDAKVRYTIKFHEDGSCKRSDGRHEKAKFTSVRTFKLWNLNPATLNDEFNEFRAQTNSSVYFGSLQVLPHSQPQTPILGALIDRIALRGVEDVHLDGEYAYLPCREGKRLTICSIKDPTSPKVVSSFTHAELGPAAGFAVNGDAMYVTSQSNSKLLVIDASDKTALRLTGSVLIGPPGGGPLYKVAYRDGHCYVAHQGEKKIFVVDVRNPTQPTVAGSVAVTSDNDGPFSVLLRGDHALIGTIFGNRNRLAVVDIKNPLEPQLVTQVFGAVVGHASGEVVGDLFFAVNWDKNAFLVFDLAETANPKLVASVVDKRLGKPNRCIVDGNRAYLPMVEGNGIAVVDIADPMSPKFLTSFHHPVMNKTYGVSIRDNLIFVGAREGNSLVVLDRQSLEPAAND